MNQYAVMPLTDYIATCDAIREKTGYTEVIKSGEMIEGISKVYTAGKLAALAESNYMHPTVSGEVISVNDVNSLEHSLGVSVGSKNLLQTTPIRKLKSNFADCFYLAKGTYTISMNFANATSWRFTYTLYHLDGNLITDTATNTTHLIGISDVLNYSSGNGGIYQNADNIVSNSMSFKTDNDYYIGINYYFGNTTTDTTTVTNAQLELGSTATDYTPYISDFSGVSVSRYGKNLFDCSLIKKGILGQDVIGLTGVGMDTSYVDGVISFGATNTGDNRRVQLFIPIEKFIFNQIYTMNIVSSLTPTGFVIGAANNGSDTSTFNKYGTKNNTNNLTFTVTDLGKPYVNVFLYYSQSEVGVTETITDIQIELGSTATPYEPYKEAQTVTVNSDGTVEGLTSISPNMTLFSNSDDIVINCQYYRDIDTYINNMIADVAISGGE